MYKCCRAAQNALAGRMLAVPPYLWSRRLCSDVCFTYFHQVCTSQYICDLVQVANRTRFGVRSENKTYTLNVSFTKHLTFADRGFSVHGISYRMTWVQQPTTMTSKINSEHLPSNSSNFFKLSVQCTMWYEALSLLSLWENPEGRK